MSQADALWRRVLDPGKMVSVGDVGEGVSTGTLLAVLSALSLRPHNPFSPLLLWLPGAAVPVPEPTIIDCEQQFAYCPFKRTPMVPATFCLNRVDGIPADFHCQMLYGLLFLILVFWAKESSMGLTPLAPQRQHLQLR